MTEEDKFLDLFKRLLENNRISFDTTAEYSFAGETRIAEIDILIDGQPVKTIVI